MVNKRGLVKLLTCLVVLLLAVAVGSALGQETTGGLQGTVKDSSGAVVPGAKVLVATPTLVGTKQVETDSSGYYRFANLPPGNYTVTISAAGFATFKREVLIEVGHLPTMDVALEVGKASEVVEVSSAAPQIDVTTDVTTTNVTDDVINYIPHGESFQSVIQFAPMARNEPLQGGLGMGGAGAPSVGNGGCSPSGCSNGNSVGYQVGGAADSENGYLVEGQNTANLIGGYSRTNVPFAFIQEVEVKTSGVEAEHGGALGGVANVIMKKGSNQFHGMADFQYNGSALNGAAEDYSRYNPAVTNTATSWGFIDPTYQQYTPKKDNFHDYFPGFTVGGPILKDRIYFFVGFDPELTTLGRTVNFAAQDLGNLTFGQNTQTYYTNARIDAAVTSKLRVFGSWLYQYQRSNGIALPLADSISQQDYFNVSSTIPSFAFAHQLGYGAPNNTMNVGADYTITQRLVSTTRFGYYFENFHNVGYPTNGTIFIWQSDGIGGTDGTGAPLPADLQQGTGYFNAANNINNTVYNASKRDQFDQDIAWFKSGWAGTHNFKFGYQFNQQSNNIFQRWNEPEVNIYPGSSSPYSPVSPTGTANCAPFEALYGACMGLYGVATLQDYGSDGYALSRNHALFAQDSWQIARGFTINAGIRIEKEYLPAEDQPTGGISHPINFGWGDKIAPRLGAAWDVFQNGKMKLFGGYGVYNDIMKLNLAISSFGGQYWQNCAYALNTDDLSTIDPAFNSAGRFCSGPAASSEGNFASGATPAGLTFLENQNFRTFPTTCSTCTSTEEGVAPNLKPYRQHESMIGVDYQLSKSLAFEARWDRQRLDHAIEDSAIFDPTTGSETFVIVNPGQGINKTFDGFYNFLYGAPSGCAPSCPPNNIPAIRDYDGVEFRLTKAFTGHWTGMFSYTWSSLWGNYSGLTNTNIGDGGGGRNSPNNSRAFDEPFFSWDSFGQSSAGPMPTNRPNTFKGWTYYTLTEGKSLSTDLGLFAYFYEGVAETSLADVGYAFPAQFGFPTLVVGSGKWVNVTQNPTTGLVTTSAPYTLRTPWFNQADVSVGQNWKVKESKTLRFQANITNLFNRRATTAYYPYIDSIYNINFLSPGGQFIADGAAFYNAAEHSWNLGQALNSSVSNGGGPITINSQYGKPYLFQLSRNIRLELRFTF